MSRLDQHISRVQNKLALDRFLDALARAVIIFGVAVWIAVLVDKFFWLRLPQWHLWLYGGLGVAAIAAIVVATRRRPTALDAAARIDQVLQTKDKFATALHVRQMSDPFAHAALLDAERTADNVSLHKRFPLRFPRASLYIPLVAVGVLMTAYWLSPIDVFNRRAQQQAKVEQVAKTDEGKKALQNAVATISEVPKALQQNESIKMAKDSLLQQLDQPNIDPARAQRTAAKALQDVNEAIKEEIKKNQKFAEAENEMKMLKQLENTPIDANTPMADVQRELQKGNFSESMNELEKVVDNFDKMKDEDKQKAAEQMQKLAQQMQQAANNPQQQQQQQKQLQQMGMNQQQAQQAQQLMQKAAQGNQQAQQQLQQMAQQMMKQMNNGQGPNQQQQQQIQQAIQQMQAQANAQQNAQQMQQAAQQMAKAMQQGAKQNQGQNQQQGAQKQQGGQQQGNQQQQQAKQQMQQAQQQMKQQMQQMQAMANDQQQVAAAQQAAQNAADQAMNGMNGGQGNQGQNPGNQGNWQGQGNNQGNGQNQKWNGQANNGMGPNQGGQGAGDRSGKEQAPYDIKPELSPSIDNDKGRILANTLVKDSAMKGESKEQLKEIAASAVQNATDEVEQDRISRQSQSVVKEYFGSIQKDASGTAAPTTAPSK